MEELVSTTHSSRGLLPSKYAKEIKNSLTLKRPLFGELHHNLSIFKPSSHSGCMQHLEERGKDIHLPIMSLSRKTHIPLIETTQHLHIICN
jgi:hypothetical protein